MKIISEKIPTNEIISENKYENILTQKQADARIRSYRYESDAEDK